MSELSIGRPVDYEVVAKSVQTALWAPAPDVLFQPITVVTQTAKELLAGLLLEVPMFGVLHVSAPDPADPASTMLTRQWVYWEKLAMARDGSVLWNPQKVVFPGVVGSVDELWMALSSTPFGDDVLFAGELTEYDRAAVAADGATRTVVVPAGSIRLSIA